MVLLGRRPAPLTLYEVSDPLRPRLLCRISGTSAHIFTDDTITYLRTAGSGTEVVLRSMGSGNERVVTSIPKPGLEGSYYGPSAWFSDGSLSAATFTPSETNTDRSEVWLFSQRYAGMLYSYRYPVGGCICRFGLPQPTLALSPDGQYLVSGFPFGKETESPFVVFRLSDRTQIKTLDSSTTFVIWDRTGHRLLSSGPSGSQAWTPEAGMTNLAGAQHWQQLAGLSPDGTKIAYTAPLGTAPQLNLRGYVYDAKSDSTRMLIDQSRAQVVFVKSGWVWYLDEAACDSNSTRPGCGPWGSAPSGKVFAMNLGDGAESAVVFAEGEAVQLDFGTYAFAPGEFWPNS
jgi:hypothetical protein